MACRKMIMAAALLLVSTATVLQTTYATTYTVGGSLGWTRPTTNSNFYYYWALNQTLLVGDVLQFNFVTGSDDVATVTEAAYETCTTANPIRTFTDAPASITLKESGDYFFLSTFSDNCAAGERLYVTALPNSASSLVATFSLVFFASISFLLLLYNCVV